MNQTGVLPLFHSDIFIKKNVGTPTQRREIFMQIEKFKASSVDISMTNFGCWRSTREYEKIEWLIDTVLDLCHTAYNFYEHADNIDRSNLSSSSFKIHYWTNVNAPGSRNAVHSHEKSHFSCVYYLEATNTGALRLINPANLLGNCNPLAVFTRDFVFDPADGDLILWPSWVPHEVEPNFSNKNRINITFDIFK